MNVNGPGVDATLENGRGSYVGVILEKGNDPGVDGNQTGWIPPHLDFPCYHPHFLGYLGPFSSASLLPLTPNPSPIYVTAPTPSLSRQIARALRHLTLFGGFGLTPPQGQTLPLFARAPYPHVFSIFSSTMWSPEKTLKIHSRRGLPNVLQTFSYA